MFICAIKRWMLPLALLALFPWPGRAEPEPGLKVIVKEDHFYRITGQDILEAGIALENLRAEKINLYHKGEAQPIALDNLGADGAVTPGTTLLFWGQFPRGETTRKNKFTSENVYQLRFDSEDPARRFEKIDGLQRTADGVAETTLKTAHLEEDMELKYYQRYSGADTDRLMWKSFAAPPRDGHEIGFQPFGDLAEGHEPETLRMLMWGSSYLPADPDHRWEIYLNETLLGTAEWDGTTHVVYETRIPEGAYLHDEPNFVRLVNALDAGNIDAIALDWIEFDYRADLKPYRDHLTYTLEPGIKAVRLAANFSGQPVRVFDLAAGRELETFEYGEADSRRVGAEYVYDFTDAPRRFVAVGPRASRKPERIELDAPSSLKAIADPPEYLLITHPRFLAQGRELVEYRRSTGMDARVVSVEDIYDEYNHGLFSPQAIRDFVDDLIAKSEGDATPLQYVFLVGDATYDYTNMRGAGENLVPTWHTAEAGYTTDYAPTVALDDYFAYGPGGEGPARVAIGRLPVREAADFEGYIAKIKEYESTGGVSVGGDDWQDDVLLISAMGFSGYADRMAKEQFEGWNVAKVYAQSGDKEGNIKLQDEIVNAVNDGTAFVYFAGHGAHFMWRTGNLDHTQQTDMFTNRHVYELKNKGKYPIVMASTCFSALYDAPAGYYKVHEDDEGVENKTASGVGIYFVEVAERGAIACIAHVGKVTVPVSHNFFKRMLTEVFENGKRRLGDAYLAAKQELHTHGYRGMTLIGDPALKIREDFFERQISMTSEAE